MPTRGDIIRRYRVSVGRLPNRSEVRDDLVRGLQRAGISNPLIALFVAIGWLAVLGLAIWFGLPVLMVPATLAVILIFSFGTS